MISTTLTGNPHLIDSRFDCAPENPLYLLQNWLETADNLKIIEPRGLVLSTVDCQGNPTSRVVLLKTVDEAGVIFASSAISKKGQDLDNNPRTAGTLWWRETLQQVNFQGLVRKLPSPESDDIFNERTREAQAVASLSTQSAALTDEKDLHGKINKLVNQQDPIVRPNTWHGYHWIPLNFGMVAKIDSINDCDMI